MVYMMCWPQAEAYKERLEFELSYAVLCTEKRCMVQISLLAMTCFYSPVYGVATALESWVFHNHTSRLSYYNVYEYGPS